MSQDQFPPPESSDQEPQSSAEEPLNPIPAAQQLESEFSPGETEGLSLGETFLEESGVRSQEPGVEGLPETPGETVLEESGVGSRESGVGSQEPGVEGLPETLGEFGLEESSGRSRESGVRSQEPGVEGLPETLGETVLAESGVGSQEPGVEGLPETLGEAGLEESGARSQEPGVRSQESEVEGLPEILEEFGVEEAEAEARRQEPGARSRESGGEVSSAAIGQSTAQRVQETWERVRPGLQAQTVKVLRGTIHLLEGVVEKLEESEIPETENRPEKMPPASGTIPGKSAPPLVTETLWDKFHSIGQRLQQWWATVLPQIRERLPESLNQKFSDRAITGAIAAVLILFLWIVPGLFSSQPKPTPVAKTRAPQTVTSPTKPTLPPQVSPPKPAEEKPTPTPVAKTIPSASPLPSPSPLPPLKLTPEQKLIARIQDQVAEISNQYVNGLIQSVQANFRSSLLIVKVGDGWYSLSQPQQNKLADEMLRRTQELDFSKLEITDAQETLLARSPVVGSEMIILKRESEAQSGSEQ